MGHSNRNFTFHQRMKSSTALVLINLLFGANAAYSADLPTNGKIVEGHGKISQNGKDMLINQNTNNMVVDWKSFSIGKNNSVTFKQPSSSSVALNRILGSDPSSIRGRLSANGKVFIVNPNGVIFGANSQVNVGGIVASTLDIGNEDFLSGNYKFEGASSNAIINQGNLTAVNGGDVVLVAAKIKNTGLLSAEEGNVVLASGERVLLDMGGVVKVEVEKAAVDALIENGGAIKADGGTVLLTAKAAGDLASTVINHTGIIEARTLSTGEKGEIYLLGDMDNDVIDLAGELDASAPDGGNGGFVETSASSVQIANATNVTTLSAKGTGGKWLIDPVDYTIAARGGDITGETLQKNLAGGDIEIQTTGSGGDVNINEKVSWSANKLTLNAHADINVNKNLIATDKASLTFIYGQDSKDGAGSNYNIADGVDVLIPNGNNFKWKKGSTGKVNDLYFGNEFLKFEDAANGTRVAVNNIGSLTAPYYYGNGKDTPEGWLALTYEDGPLDVAVGTGDGNKLDVWSKNDQIFTSDEYDDTPKMTYINARGVSNGLSINIKDYKEGTGKITTTLNVNSAETKNTIDIVNTYTLEKGASYLKAKTTVVNKSDVESLKNVNLWVGTRDDNIVDSDDTKKVRGNIGKNGFEKINKRTDKSNAIKITQFDSDKGAAVVFYSKEDNAQSVIADCCNFEYIYKAKPTETPVETKITDGSYGVNSGLGDLASNKSKSMTWYYAVGTASNIGNTVKDVGVSAGLTPVPRPVVKIASKSEPKPKPAAKAVVKPTPKPTQEKNVALSIVKVPQVKNKSQPILKRVSPKTLASNNIVGGLEFVEISVPKPTVAVTATPIGNMTGSIIPNATVESKTSNVGGDIEISDAEVINMVDTNAGQSDFSEVFIFEGGMNYQVDTPAILNTSEDNG